MMNEENENIIENNYLTYNTHERMINIWRGLKFAYMFAIIFMLFVVNLLDDNDYIDGFRGSIYAYIVIESLYLIIYIYKSRRGYSNIRFKIKCGAFFIRCMWVIFTIYGFFVWIDEKSNNTVLFYFTGYIFISNLTYIILSSVVTCTYPCVLTFLIRNHDKRKQRVIMSIINDATDIQIFSNTFNLGFLHNTSCGICFEDYEEGNELRVLKCGHYFHKHCITPWLIDNNSCPYCRGIVYEEI